MLLLLLLSTADISCSVSSIWLAALLLLLLLAATQFGSPLGTLLLLQAAADTQLP
jgi:hypothetical protein